MQQPVKYHIDTMAFAFAHRLWPVYYAADLDVSFGDLTPEEEYIVEQYHERQEARKADG